MIRQRGDRSEYISCRSLPDANIGDDKTNLNRDVATTTQIVCQTCQCAARLQTIDCADASSIVLDVSESTMFSKETRVTITDVALLTESLSERFVGAPLPKLAGISMFGKHFFTFFFLRRMGKNTALAHHTSTYFHTRRASI